MDNDLQTLERDAPTWARALSNLGRRVGRAAEAVGGADLGLSELRDAWWARQRSRFPEGTLATRPIATVGLTHGLSLVADLFAEVGRTVVVPRPFWGNYRQIFALRTGASFVEAACFPDGARFDPRCFERVFEPADAIPALVVLNFPSNPGGWSPPARERAELVESLIRMAERRPLVVVADDAYFGLVHEPDVPRNSIFGDLATAHPNLAAIAVDGATKEFGFFGARVGFLTLALPPDSAAAEILERKIGHLIRATVGPPSEVSQRAVLAALRGPETEREVKEVQRLLAARYRALRSALDSLDPALLRPLPSNAGCFAEVELPLELGMSAEEVRRHLVREEGVGLIATGPRSLRIAHCSVAEEALPELVARLARGVSTLREAGASESEALR